MTPPSAYNPGSKRDMCKCGHSKDTHYKDRSGLVAACLGVHCDCVRYRDESEPDTLRPPGKASAADGWHTRDDDAKPHDDPYCNCTGCRRWMSMPF